MSSALWAHVAGKGPQLLSGWDGNLWQRILFFARFEVPKQGDLAVGKHEVFNSSCGFTSAFHKTVNLDGCKKKDLLRRACIEDECEQRTLDFLLSFDISSEVFCEFLVTIKISQGSHESTDVLPRDLWAMICVSWHFWSSGKWCAHTAAATCVAARQLHIATLCILFLHNVGEVQTTPPLKRLNHTV